MHSLWTALAKLYPLETLIGRTVGLLAVIIGALVASTLVGRAVRAAIAAAERRVPDPVHRQRVVTLLLLSGSISRYIIAFFAAFYVLLNLGLNIGPLIMGVGIVGLAVGFGAQNLVRDVVSGFFIILEGQYGVGDLVEINGMFGTVEEVGLRITKLRDPNGQLRFLPNGSITQANRFTERGIAYTASVPVAEGEYEAAALVQQALHDFDQELHVFVAAPTVGPVQTLKSYARIVPLTLSVVPGRHALVTEKLPGRLTAALARAGHPIPEGTEVTVVLAHLRGGRQA